MLTETLSFSGKTQNQFLNVFGMTNEKANMNLSSIWSSYSYNFNPSNLFKNMKFHRLNYQIKNGSGDWQIVNLEDDIN